MAYTLESRLYSSVVYTQMFFTDENQLGKITPFVSSLLYELNFNSN